VKPYSHEDPPVKASPGDEVSPHKRMDEAGAKRRKRGEASEALVSAHRFSKFTVPLGG
jgi:hypothetical protein